MRERIKKYAREHKNMSLPQLEVALGFSSGLISKWDKSSPSIDKVAKVAAFLGVTLDYLFFGDSQGHPVNLSMQEYKIIDEYRSLPDERKANVDQYVSDQYDLSKAKEKTAANAVQ
ncbi:MAG: helix-turn-helix transcriptional regulator [Fibrobacter sp.]|nr:helix-turn-helix transcriptional regulator [Clostridia bacterium]MBR4680742.1 helix-turn-helix transcriptional regulator [Fibrobacter sp.]